VILYLDTSNLVKLYLDEAESTRIQQLVANADAVATSVLAYAEARAVFARRRRERLMTAAEYRSVIRQFDEDWSGFLVISLDAEVGSAAGRLADRHDLRGADAVHLASFQALLARSRDGEVEFSCSDAALVRAARKLG
jgi:predicted nucleic acid-binding protein